MATGPWHYREAERLAQLAKDKSAALLGVTMSAAQADLEQGQISQTIALAHVHATLADVAATAQNIRRNNAMDAGLADDWIEVSR
ncbi:hypothetical protein Drose_04515 [Dactylosporangium roseum]|uniref:Uncharacterized protein n=1 Tax=Dactylosporangium roseum TaxID=47989 RepID=A0ABY5Z663_9ACTN|nr:hypothetical protein [Dactylosporangium roseum]UWZ37553.1 hypothetical protein Drose_04515 [Dactylosporangium roseum]